MLVTRIAAGDSAAFRALYAFQVMRVWRGAVQLVPSGDARAVTRSTFVDIWHLAGHHLDHEACEISAWIVSITARHVDDRARNADARSPYGDDQHTRRELITLLGRGRAMIRTAPGTTRVIDVAS